MDLDLPTTLHCKGSSQALTEPVLQEMPLKRRRWRYGALADHARRTTSEEVFIGCSRALKVRQPWLDQILKGEKLIEIRSTPCPHVNQDVLLMEVGSMMIRGKVHIVASRPLTADESKVHAAAIATLPAYKRMFAWELGTVEEFKVPIQVPSSIARGSVTWLTKDHWQRMQQVASPNLSAESP